VWAWLRLACALDFAGCHRASQAGASDAQLDAAADGEDEVGELTELIVDEVIHGANDSDDDSDDSDSS
jgi:hypothetical protein